MSRRAISSSAKAESTDTRRGLPVASGKAVRIEAQPVRSRPDLATTRTEFIELPLGVIDRARNRHWVHRNYRFMRKYDGE
jgi:hypothetical protein